MSDPEYLKAFICLCGDVDNAALTEQGCFAIEDSQGRSWLCWKVDNAAISSDSASAALAVAEIQEKLMALGYSGTGGTRMVVCVTRLPDPITWEEQLGRLRDELGEKDDDKGEEWKRGRQEH